MKTARRSTSRFSKTTGMAKGAVRSLGVSLGAAGIVYALKKAIQSFVAFEKQLAMVSTMLDEGSMKHMAEYKRGLERLSTSMGESTETLSKGLYDVLSASIAPAKAMKVLAISARAAKGGMTDTGVAADAITTILNSYSLSAERAADVSDWLFAVVKRGKTTFAELAGSVGKSAALAATAGMSLEEFGAAIATITRGGMRTEEAMTGVNAIIKGFIAPAKEAKMAAAKLGIDLSSLTLTTLGLANVLEELEGVSPEVLTKIFPNIRAIKALAILRQNLEGYKKDIALLTDRAGEANKAFEKMAATQATAWERIGQMWTHLGRQLGEEVSGGITDTASAITNEMVPALQLAGAMLKGLTWQAQLLVKIGQRDIPKLAWTPEMGKDVAGGLGAMAGLRERRAAEADARRKAQEAMWATLPAMPTARDGLDLPTHTFAADEAKRRAEATVEGGLAASKLVQLENVRVTLHDQLHRLHVTERDLLFEKLAILGETTEETNRLLGIYDRIAKKQEAMAKGRELKAFASTIRESVKSPLQQLEDFRKKLAEAVAGGQLQLYEGLVAYQKRARELQTPVSAADRGPGEFQAIRSAFMDLRGMGGGKSAEVSELERIRAVNERTNALIEERLGAGLN